MRAQTNAPSQSPAVHLDMAAGLAGSCSGSGDRSLALLRLVHDIVKFSGGPIATGMFSKHCTDLVRRIALLTHLFEEMGNFGPLDASSSCCSTASFSWLPDLVGALQAAKELLLVASSFNSNYSSDGAAKKIAFRFQCVTRKLEKALANFPYNQFDISEEVQEQVELVRAQLRRASGRYGPLNSKLLSCALSQLLDKKIDQNRILGTSHTGNVGSIDKIGIVSSNYKASISNSANQMSDESGLRNSSVIPDVVDSTSKNLEHIKKHDTIAIPDDFLCPISLELMRDPVIVATGQTYERSYIQRWIDCGNATCPKTQQKLQHSTLTPNYVLRSLITQWCVEHKIEQSMGLANGKIKKSDGSFRDVSGDIVAIEALVRKLSSRLIEERRAAVTEIRSLSKRSTDNRIIIADAGAIPALVNLLTTEDMLTQENAVTSILNLSIFENNKGLIMLAGAIPSIVQVLRAGSMEARENAAATLFSLSLADENKIIIGASGAIPALVELLQNGSARGKKDAATALYNLCIYQGNKGRAIRAGIIIALLKMLSDSSSSMVDEALTILSVLAGNQEANVAIVKASTIPVLIDLLRTGLPRNKENAAAILLSLCKRDNENLACISRLGAVIPLTELTKSGTERAKRRATSLLEHLRRLPEL